MIIFKKYAYLIPIINTMEIIRDHSYHSIVLYLFTLRIIDYNILEAVRNQKYGLEPNSNQTY